MIYHNGFPVTSPPCATEIKKAQMFKTLFGSAAVLLILIFALVAPAGVANAQQAGQTPAAADPAPAEPAADPIYGRDDAAARHAARHLHDDGRLHCNRSRRR